MNALFLSYNGSEGRVEDVEIKEIFEIAGAIVASVGGAGVIIVGLSSWLGKVWANRLLEDEKAAHNKELEEYKERLQEQLGRVEAINEKALYISKAQFDNEYKIYSEIWDKMHEARVASEMLYPRYEEVPASEDERKKYNQSKYTTYIEKYNSYTMTIEKYAPFYQESFYKKLIEIRNICHSLGVCFEIYEINNQYDKPKPKEVKKEVYHTSHENLKIIVEDLQNSLREYLRKLRLEE